MENFYFLSHNSRTQDQSVKFFNTVFRIDKDKNFIQHTSCLWNLCHRMVVTITGIHVFQRGLDQFMEDYVSDYES